MPKPQSKHPKFSYLLKLKLFYILDPMNYPDNIIVEGYQNYVSLVSDTI